MGKMKEHPRYNILSLRVSDEELARTPFSQLVDRQMHTSSRLIVLLQDEIRELKIDRVKLEIENRELRAQYENLSLEHENLLGAWKEIMCEEHRNCGDLYDQYQTAGGDCLLCMTQKAQAEVAGFYDNEAGE